MRCVKLNDAWLDSSPEVRACLPGGGKEYRGQRTEYWGYRVWDMLCVWEYRVPKCRDRTGQDRQSTYSIEGQRESRTDQSNKKRTDTKRPAKSTLGPTGSPL